MGRRILFKNKVKTGKKIIQLGTKLIHWLMFPYIYHLPVIFYFPFSFNFPPIKWDWVLLQGCEKTKKDCEISGWVVIDLECLWNHSIRFLWSNVQKQGAENLSNTRLWDSWFLLKACYLGFVILGGEWMHRKKKPEWCKVNCYNCWWYLNNTQYMFYIIHNGKSQSL